MAKLVKMVKLSGVAVAESGISVGGNKDTLGPGGVDNPVIKNPMNNVPYIPGSSLKGRMRALIESTVDTYSTDGKINPNTPCGCGKASCKVCSLFGAHKNMNAQSGPARAIFKDMHLVDAYAKNPNIIETKTETMIDRKTGVASTGSLRPRERVADGAAFNWEILVKIYDGDNEKALLDMIEKGLKMVELNGIGAKTSSGSGQIKFGEIKKEDIKF